MRGSTDRVQLAVTTVLNSTAPSPRGTNTAAASVSMRDGRALLVRVSHAVIDHGAD